jgi:hypothetical protein
MTLADGLAARQEIAVITWPCTNHSATTYLSQTVLLTLSKPVLGLLDLACIVPLSFLSGAPRNIRPLVQAKSACSMRQASDLSKNLRCKRRHDIDKQGIMNTMPKH